MKRNIFTLMAGALLLGMSSMSAMAAGKTIAVSWKTYQEERWKTDEAAIRAVVEAAGDKLVTTDAQLSAQKQAADDWRDAVGMCVGYREKATETVNVC